MDMQEMDMNSLDGMRIRESVFTTMRKEKYES